jgi:hypothetical protein
MNESNQVRKSGKRVKESLSFYSIYFGTKECFMQEFKSFIVILQVSQSLFFFFKSIPEKWEFKPSKHQ